MTERRRSGHGDLVTAVLDGTPEAFDEIVSRFERTAHASAFALLRDSHLAQDVVQEAFVDAYQTLHKLRDRDAFPGWFRRIVFKHADRIRRRPQPPLAGMGQARAVRDNTLSPEERLLADEQSAVIRGALDRLPEHERIVTSLFYMGGQSHREISDFLVLPLSTIKKRLHDARKRLRGDLEGLEKATRSSGAPAPPAIDVESQPIRAEQPQVLPATKEKKVHVTHVTPLLNVRDVERSMEFYREALGFECRNRFVQEGRVRWARIGNGNVEIMLNITGSVDEYDDVHEARPRRGNFSDCVLYLGVEDANSLYERFQRDGFTTSEIFDAEYGVREFHMRDFDGYELSITSPLPAKA